ncbi:MFS transporter [Streptomyces sp. NPDC050535]|uniref:MFS transporter n=1 Tax=Streptomyces sp. NPDC050535 TaxID=3365626 RepID=UPI0037A556D4
MTSVPVPEQRATYREVLADRRFRLLFVTRTLAVTADSLRIMTLSMLVFATTGSPLLGALTFGIGFLPQLAGSLLLGSLADRGRPRPLITAGYGLQCAVATVMGVAQLPVALVLVLLAAVSCLTPVFSGATNRLVAETLTGDAYVLGRSLSNMSSSAAQLLGLAGGGAAVGLLGPRTALLLSAGAYLVAAVAVRLRLPDLPAPEQAVRHGSDRGAGSVLRHSWYGNTKLLAERRVRTLLLAQWLPPAFVTGAESLIVPFAGGQDMPAGSAGPLLACLPVGMLVGDLAVARLVRPAVRERLVATLVVVLGLPLAGFALDPPLPVCAALLLVTGTGFAYALGLQRPFLDAIPEARRGQAFGLLNAGLMSVQGVGPVVFGAVAEFTDAGAAMALAGLATVCVAAYLAPWRTRLGR